MSKATVRDALKRERKATTEIAGVVDRGRAAEELIALLQAELRRFGQIRAHAYVQAQRDFGASYGDLAAMFGVSRQRAHEIVRKAA